MKLLHFADLHLDTTFRWAPPDVARRRRQALRQTLTRIANLAQEVEPDAILCGGDLYEQDRFSADTSEFLRTTFEHLRPVPIFIAPGNHDWYGTKSLYAQVEWPPNVHVFTDPDFTPVELADGVTLWGAAFTAPTKPQGFLDGFSADRDGVNVALFHGSERAGLYFEAEGKHAHAPFDAEEIQAAGLDYAFLGHYHQPREEAGYLYPGNPDPLTFGESGERGPVLAALSGDGSVRCTTYDVAVTAVHDKTVDVTDCTHAGDVQEAVREALAELEGYVRVTIEGELPTTVDLQLGDLRPEELAPHLDACQVRFGRVHVAYDLPVIEKEQTVRGQFLRDVMAADLPPDERDRVITTGLRALEGRVDLEVP